MVDGEPQTQHTSTTIIIYNKKLAGYLLFNGCHLLGIMQNKKHPEFNVFKFKDTGSLKDLVSRFNDKSWK